MHGMNANFHRKRLQNGADNDDGGNGIQKAAHHQEDAGHEKPCGDLAHAPGGNAGQDGLRDFVIGEQPAKGRSRSHAKQRHRRQPSGFTKRPVKPFQIHLPIDNQGKQAGIKHGDARTFSRGEPAENLAADDDEGRHQRGQGNPGGKTQFAQVGARIGGVAALLRIGMHGCHLHQANQQAGNDACEEKRTDRNREHAPPDNH